MSLFKIFKGKKSRLNDQPKHDGYAWYTEDDGGFYVDAENDEGVLSRKRINDASNTSISVSGIQATTVEEAIQEVSDKSKGFEYDSDNEELVFGKGFSYTEDSESLSFG